MKNAIKFLTANDDKFIYIKLVLLAILLFGGFMFWPMMVIAFVLIALFIIFERAAFSLCYVFFFMPFMYVFTFPNPFGLSFWNLIIIVFVLVIGVRYIYDLIKKNKKFNFKLILPFLAFFVFTALPINHGFSILTVLETLVWLALFYEIIIYFDEIKLENLVLIFIVGLLYSSVIGFYIDRIPYLSEMVVKYYIGSTLRFSGLTVSPNIYYAFVLTAMALLYVLVYNNNLNRNYLALFLPLTLLGVLSISKTFMIGLAVLGFLIFISLLSKQKNNKKQSIENCAIILVTLVLAIIILLPTAKLAFSRSIVDESSETGTVLFNGRTLIWETYLTDFVSSWKNVVFGKGLGSATGLLNTNSHSAYIQFIYELGVAGGLIYLVGAIWIYVLTKRKILNDILCFSWIALAILMFYSLMENHFFSQVGNMLLMVSVAIIFYNKEKEDANT